MTARISGTKTLNRRFGLLEDAEQWANDKFIGCQRRGQASLAFSDHEWHEFAAGLLQLRERGITVKQAIVHAPKTLSQASLTV